MLIYLVLSLAFLNPSLVFADEAAALVAQIADSAAVDDKPAPELLALEKELTQKQEAAASDHAAQGQMKAYVVKFRATLGETMARVPPSPANQAVHARILVRLGDSSEALAGLNAALKKDPNNPKLAAAKGFVLYDQKDYAGSAAAANALLRNDPMNQEALWLKHASEDRNAPTPKLPNSPWASSTQAPSISGAPFSDTPDDSNKPFKPDMRGLNKVIDVPNASLPTLNASKPEPSKGTPTPLVPLTEAIGITAAAYGVLRSKETWSGADGLNPSPNISPEDRVRARQGVAILAGTFAVSFAALELGPEILPPAIAFMQRGFDSASESFLKVAGSNAGSILPSEVQSAGAAVAAHGAEAAAEFTPTESQVIGEARQILGSPEIARLQEAFRAGKPVTVTIGGRVIQYEPDLPASGMTSYANKGFYIGREAFKSTQEFQKTVLHELYRLATSASGDGVSGNLASTETNAAAKFAEKAYKVLNP